MSSISIVKGAISNLKENSLLSLFQFPMSVKSVPLKKKAKNFLTFNSNNPYGELYSILCSFTEI